jgi:MSHA biogenesis protein MshJ
MKLPAGIEKNFAKFDALSIRERALVAGAALIAVVMIWTLAAFDPITKKERFLNGEITSIQDAIAAAAQSMTDLETTDPTSLALAKEKKLQAQLQEINTQLASRSGGLIEPERMVQVIHDVLAQQPGVTLISLQNKPVTSLIKPVAATDAGAHTATDAGTDAPVSEDTGDSVAETTVASGPYVHPVELIIEGQYLDVLQYLRTLEALPWRFNWKVFELNTTTYPLNRVRIEMSTLSMDKDWIGV